MYKKLIALKSKEVQNAIKLLKEYNFEIYAPVDVFCIKL